MFVFMQNSKRRIVFSALIAILIYFVPNLVQDIHRVLGHHEVHQQLNTHKESQFQNQTAKCPVCVFEFNVVDEIADFIYSPLVFSQKTLFAEKSENQIQNKAFHYYNLRAPPQA
jgi:hypothetical protein